MSAKIKPGVPCFLDAPTNAIEDGFKSGSSGCSMMIILAFVIAGSFQTENNDLALHLW
jgi:hypothetical protein